MLLKLLTDIQLKARWDLICNPNNHTSCHATPHVRSRRHDGGGRPDPNYALLLVQGEPAIDDPGIPLNQHVAN